MSGTEMDLNSGSPSGRHVGEWWPRREENSRRFLFLFLFSKVQVQLQMFSKKQCQLDVGVRS